MIYVPKGQLNSKSVLECTKPDKLFDVNGYVYIGYYVIQNNVPYSSDINGNILEKLYYNDILEYRVYKQLNIDNDEFVITPHYPVPNKKDYENGNINRYFLKRKFTTDIDITEVSKDVYNKLKGLNNAITQLYEYIQINWIIVGNKEEVKKLNNDSILLQEKQYIGFKSYLVNDLQFYKSNK